MRKLARYWLPLVLYIACIFVLSSFSSIPRALSLGLNDKLLHFIEYTFLAALMARALRSTAWPRNIWICWLLTLGIVLALGGLDEYFQSTIPGRDSDVLDLLADGGGGLLGGGAYLFIKHKLATKKPS